MSKFNLISEKTPSRDQEKAIKSLLNGVHSGKQKQLLLGVTGSGKTFTVANVINLLNIPTLIIIHNKTLAAQWYQELKELFPENSVQFYISIFDFYRPESYVPRTSTYIEKESVINEEITKCRLNAIASLMSRGDTIIVSSVSCIFGAGNPSSYEKTIIHLYVGKVISTEELAEMLWEAHFLPTDELDISLGMFRATSNTVDVHTFAKEEKAFIKINVLGNEVESIYASGKSGQHWVSLRKIDISPYTTHVVDSSVCKKGIISIQKELDVRAKELMVMGKIEEANRLVERTNHDIAFIKEHKTCNGIENYYIHFSDRKRGEAPYSILDFFPKQFLTIIDESHQSIPQMRAMHKSTYERISKLVEFGYRLPSAHDNRPLTFEEAELLFDKVIYVSATPSKWEIDASGNVAEQIIRPTGLVDPEIEMRSLDGQIDDCIAEIKSIKTGKSLVITITKKMAESIARFFHAHGIKASHMHSELVAHERYEILNDLRRGNLDVIVGINLLREGIDLPEVTRVFILDADQEGFLRSTTSLMQICGRAARNVEGKVILYADRNTKSIQETVKESSRRRKIQQLYNKENDIMPNSTKRSIIDTCKIPGYKKRGSKKGVKMEIKDLTKEMEQAAAEHNYKKAIELRQRIKVLKTKGKSK